MYYLDLYLFFLFIFLKMAVCWVCSDWIYSYLVVTATIIFDLCYDCISPDRADTQFISGFMAPGEEADSSHS